MDIQILYNTKASETVHRMKELVKSQNINLILIKESSQIKSNIPIIYYGSGDGFNLSKEDQCVLFEDVIDNTLINSEEEVGDYDVVVVKNPTRIMLGKDYLNEDTDESGYKYITNKSEWRVNYSFGKVNSVYNKNLLPNTIFGKADITHWSYETDESVRKLLIDTVKGIASIISEDYPKLQHFGIDIIRNNDDGTYYFLELNKAHSLNDENCQFFIKGFLELNNLTIPPVVVPLTRETARPTLNILTQTRNMDDDTLINEFRRFLESRRRE